MPHFSAMKGSAVLRRTKLFLFVDAEGYNSSQRKGFTRLDAKSSHFH